MQGFFNIILVAVAVAVSSSSVGAERATAVLGVVNETGQPGGDLDTAKAVLTSTKVVDAAAAQVLGEDVRWQDVARIELLPAGKAAVTLSVTTQGDAPAGLADRLLQSVADVAIRAMRPDGDHDEVSDLNAARAEWAEVERKLAELQRERSVLLRDRTRRPDNAQLRTVKQSELDRAKARLEATQAVLASVTAEGSPAADRLAALQDAVDARERLREISKDPKESALADAALAEARVRLAEARMFQGLVDGSPYREQHAELPRLQVRTLELQAELDALAEKEDKDDTLQTELAELDQQLAELQRRQQVLRDAMQRGNVGGRRTTVTRLVLLTPPAKEAHTDARTATTRPTTRSNQ
jgi:hypothetical protein